jgi:hypothetical protein
LPVPLMAIGDSEGCSKSSSAGAARVHLSSILVLDHTGTLRYTTVETAPVNP